MDAASLCLGKSRTNFKFYFVILRTQIPKKTQRAAEHHLADGERSQRKRGGSILVGFFFPVIFHIKEALGLDIS